MKKELTYDTFTQFLICPGFLGVLFLLLLSLSSCNLNLQPQGTRVLHSGPQPTPELKLPSPVKPTMLPADQVLNILFTSNGDGDVEPCG